MKVNANVPENSDDLSKNIRQQFSSRHLLIGLAIGCVLTIIILVCTFAGVIGWASTL